MWALPHHCWVDHALIQELDAVHAERKATYNTAVGQLEARAAAATSEVAAMQAELTKAREREAALSKLLSTLQDHAKRLSSAASADALHEKCVWAMGWCVWPATARAS